MAEVTWNCAACGFAIADGGGWVQARMSDVNAQQEAVARWKATYRPPGTMGVSAGDLLKYPEPVSWTALHEACDQADGEPYTLGVEQLRTPWELVRWSAHLMEKTWLKSTTWHQLLWSKYNEREE